MKLTECCVLQEYFKYEKACREKDARASLIVHLKTHSETHVSTESEVEALADFAVQAVHQRLEPPLSIFESADDTLFGMLSHDAVRALSGCRCG